MEEKKEEIDPRVKELQDSISRLSDLLADPSQLYKEHILKDDEKTIKPNLNARNVDEFNSEIERRTLHVQYLKENIEAQEIAVPEEVYQSVETAVMAKEDFLAKGSTNWDKKSSFKDPSFYIENNVLLFQYKDESPIDYAEINEISPDGKITVSSQGGTIGDGVYIKVPVIVGYIEKGSIGTKFTVTVVNANGEKGFFTYVYK